MNMSVIHGMARLHRKTGDPRYRRLSDEILEDFERAGDYYRTGLAGKEFFRSPRPRWESLHALQGLVELYRITGDESYRIAFLHHWASIRRFDFRNTGGFSSGERATGNPYENSPIETCCVVAFQEVMIDALRLTGRARIADDLEQSTWNAMLGAQHPSGAWCTYNTPMAGERIPSHIQIRFQAREDTPHLNCCSVNGPRGYGAISQWGVMRSENGLTVNYYGPLTARVRLEDGTQVTLVLETTYPVGDTIDVRLELDSPKRFQLSLRIPAWSRETRVTACNQRVPHVRPGGYVVLDRQWQSGDTVSLNLDMRLHYLPGDLDQFGRVSLYRGPILLALDSRFTTDVDAEIDVAMLSQARRVDAHEWAGASARPWVAVDVPTADGGKLRMIDFANAGMTTLAGRPVSTYTTWIKAKGALPPEPVAWHPADGSKVGPGAIRFVWRKPAAEAKDRFHTVLVAERPDFKNIVLRSQEVAGGWTLLPAEQAGKLKPYTSYYWMVVARNAHGRTESIPPFKRFVVDPDTPPLEGNWPYGQRESDQMITEAELRGSPQPAFGELLDAGEWKSAPGPDGRPEQAIELNGERSMIKYRLQAFPEEDYTVSVRFAMMRLPSTHYGQVFSAWAGGMDDPLRLVVQEGRLHARIEAGAGYSTEGVPLEVGRWYHVAGVKQGTKLTLYVDGKPCSTCKAPPVVASNAVDFALGGNPNYHGPEFLPAKFADLKFYARALSEEEVRELHAQSVPRLP
jgi:hypothetical protein